MLKLSIITINRNNAEGLRKTMESVLLQTSKEFEYIVVDGASTDNSVEIIQGFIQSTNQYINFISEPDTGIYNAMNKGIRLAKGDSIQFLNSGDLLVAPDVTERMLSNLPDCAICYGNMLKVLTDGTFFYNKKIPNISMLTFYCGSINHSSTYIRRSLFDKYGPYDESLKIVSDWKFYLIAIGLHNETIEYLDIDVTYFDMNGISNTNSSLDKAERLQVLKETLPAAIFADYEKYATSILQMKRINRYKLTKWIVWFIERVLFKIEKWETKRKKEHLF